MGTTKDQIDVCCLNVNGLRDKRKCQSVLTHISSKCKGIIMLQETHSTEGCEKMWSNLTGAKCYFAHGTSDSRGVATLLPTDLATNVNRVVKDSKGRFLLLEVILNNVNYVFLNVYAPTKDKKDEQVSFLHNVSEILQDYIDSRIVWAGDFNTYLDPDIDMGELKSLYQIIH